MSAAEAGVRCRGLDHVALSVADAGRMAEWYERALGMAVEERFTHPANGTRIVLLRGAGGVRLELIELLGSEPDPNAATNPDESLMWHGYGHLAFRVAGIEGAFAALLAAGAGSVREPGPSFVPGARYAYVADPEGNQIEIVERAGGE